MKRFSKYIFYTSFYIGVNIIGLPEIHYHIFFRKNKYSNFQNLK